MLRKHGLPQFRCSGMPPCHSLSEFEINLAKLRQDHRVLKLARRRIAGAGKCQRTRVSRRKRASPTFGYD